MPGPTKLTLRLIEKLPPAPRCARTNRVKSYGVRDEQVRGLMCVVHERSRVFAVQRDVYHPTERDPANPRKRLKIGTRRANLGPTSDFATVDEAREKAREVIAAWKQGADPRARHSAPTPAKKSATLQSAWEAFRESRGRKGLGAGTVAGYADQYKRYLNGWADRALAGLTGQDCHDRHIEITTVHGPYVANQSMRLLRAIYNHAAKLDRTLPANPVSGVDFNEEHRREEVVQDLAAWWREVQEMPSPARRDWHVFVILTGMRRAAACQARVEHLDLEAGFLRVPNPKGGRRRAFDLPLSDHLVGVLRARVADNIEMHGRENPWLFPSDIKEGDHIRDPAQRSSVSAHVLRHTFATMAAAAGVPQLDLQLLLNHKLQSVTGGYIHQSELRLRLRDMTNKVTAHILAQVGA